MKSITVFCGSSPGIDPDFGRQAVALGKTLAEKNIRLVYGGAKVGLMGMVADGALALSGTVIGVIPQFLRTKEVAHEGLTELIIVHSMHERKTKMDQLCDGVIALPGGFGTLEELFEMLTWAQLGLHQKPIGLLNTNGYYNDLINMLDKMVENGLLKQINREMLIVHEEIDGLIEEMTSYQAPEIPKWISNNTT